MKNKTNRSINTGEEKGVSDYPLVSIVTPLLNRVKYLEPCIQSVLTQTYPRLEHIFVDGGSSDGTVEMLSRYQLEHPVRIRFISEPDRGVGDAWNKGLRMAQGEIFGWLGSDDTYEPEAVEIVVDFFRKNPDAYFLYGDLNYMNEKGEFIRRHHAPDLVWKELINDFCAIPTPSAFYRREVIEKIGDFMTDGNDLEYWIRVARGFQTYRVKKVLANFRSHQDSQTGSPKTLGRWKREDFLISLRYGGSPFSPRSKRYYQYVISEVIKPKLGHFYPPLRKAWRVGKKLAGRKPSPDKT
jgi:glycosyltransferase involved in cell wall biosynthesis